MTLLSAHMILIAAFGFEAQADDNGRAIPLNDVAALAGAETTLILAKVHTELGRRSHRYLLRNCGRRYNEPVDVQKEPERI